MNIETDTLESLDDLEAYLQTFKDRCGLQFVGYGDYQDILAAQQRGIETPCMWCETEETTVKWDSGRLVEASFRLLVLEGTAKSLDDTNGIGALQRAAMKRLLPHVHKTIEAQQDTILYQMELDGHRMQFKVTIGEPVKPEKKYPYGSDLICGVYLEKVHLSIVSPFQDHYKTHSLDF